MEMRADIKFARRNDLNPNLGKKRQNVIVRSRPALCQCLLLYNSDEAIVVVGKSITTNPGYFSSSRFLIGKGLNVYCFHNWGHL
jgi:hypothetical protein